MCNVRVCKVMVRVCKVMVQPWMAVSVRGCRGAAVPTSVPLLPVDRGVCVLGGGDSRWVPGAPRGSAQRRGGGGGGGGVESIPELHPPVPAPPDPRPSAGTAGR